MSSRDEKYWYYRKKRGYYKDYKVQMLMYTSKGNGMAWATLLGMLECESLETKGDIIIPKSEGNITKALAQRIGYSDEEELERAVKECEKLGLIDKTFEDDKVILAFPLVKSNVGRSSKRADKEREKELEEREEQLEMEAVKLKKYGYKKNILLAESEYEQLKSIYGEELLKQSITKLALWRIGQKKERTTDFSEVKSRCEELAKSK